MGNVCCLCVVTMKTGYVGRGRGKTYFVTGAAHQVTSVCFMYTVCYHKHISSLW
jgi:hypothetical protein